MDTSLSSAKKSSLVLHHHECLTNSTFLSPHVFASHLRHATFAGCRLVFTGRRKNHFRATPCNTNRRFRLQSHPTTKHLTSHSPQARTQPTNQTNKQTTQRKRGHHKGQGTERRLHNKQHNNNSKQQQTTHSFIHHCSLHPHSLTHSHSHSLCFGDRQTHRHTDPNSSFLPSFLRLSSSVVVVRHSSFIIHHSSFIIRHSSVGRSASQHPPSSTVHLPTPLPSSVPL